MPKPPPASNVSQWPVSESQTTSTRRAAKSASQPSLAQRRTAKKSGTASKSAKVSKHKRMNRRDSILRKFDVDPVELARTPPMTPFLRQNNIKIDRFIEVLRCDQDEDSQEFVQFWDEQTPATRSIVGLDGLAMAVDLTPRRLWELFCGGRDGAGPRVCRHSTGTRPA